MTELAFVPKNEQGLISLFSAKAGTMGWVINSVGTKFPDAVLEKDGELWRVEFEYKASNFIAHGHNYRKCDLIVCWVNNIGEFYIPIYSLKDDRWTESTDDNEHLSDRFHRKLSKSQDLTLSRHVLTARGDENYRARLEYVMKHGGYQSMSTAILSLIDKEYDRLINGNDSSDMEKRNDNIYKVIIAMSQGKKFTDMESIRKFLMGEIQECIR